MSASVSQRRNPDAERAFHALINRYVVVGVPESESARPDSPMNNAQIGYFQEYGSDAQKVPPRSWLHSPLKAIKEANIARLEATSKAALADVKNAKSIINKGLTRVGLESVSKIIQTIDAHIPPPLANSTIEARLEKPGRKTLKAKFDKSVDEGFINRADINQFFTPLVDTGSFKSSITYVIRGK